MYISRGRGREREREREREGERERERARVAYRYPDVYEQVYIISEWSEDVSGLPYLNQLQPPPCLSPPWPSTSSRRRASASRGGITMVT